MLKGQQWTLGACIAVIAVLLGAGHTLAAPTVQATPECEGVPATIVHVGFDTTVVGTDADDVVVIDGGWNSVHAGDGDDRICIRGHFNAVFGESGDDILIATGLYNNMYGGDGDDTLDASDASDFMQGGPGRNTCNGQSC